MKNQMQIFENQEFGKVRVVEVEGQPWFVGRDVTAALEYQNGSRDINRHVDPEDRQNYRNGTLEKSNRGLTIINESGLYSLILSSKLPSAKRFKRWVTMSVLPTIRKHGVYITEAALEEAAKSQAFAFELFCKLRAEKEKATALKGFAEELAPKALYCELILQSKNTIPISVIAKDYGMTAASFNMLLHYLGIQYKIGGVWLLYQPYAGKGYTKTRTYFHGESSSAMHTSWTQAGRLFLYETLKKSGIVPAVESCKPAV